MGEVALTFPVANFVDVSCSWIFRMDLSRCSSPFFLAPAGRLMQGIVRACDPNLDVCADLLFFVSGDLGFVVFFSTQEGSRMVQLKWFGGLALAAALVMGANNAEAGHHHHHHSSGSYGSCGSSGGSYGSWGSCGSSGGSWGSSSVLQRIEWFFRLIRFLWLIGLVRWRSCDDFEQRGARRRRSCNPTAPNSR